MDEIQILLSEKRTSLSVMRTGIAVFALPLSVLSVLIATSRFYTLSHVLHLLIPLMIILVMLILLGIYLVTHAFRRIRSYDQFIRKLKDQYGILTELVEKGVQENDTILIGEYQFDYIF